MNTSSLQKNVSEIFPSVIDVPDEYNYEISGLALDSRLIEKQFLFVAKPGLKVDGRDYIDDAVANGASVILQASETSGLSFHSSGCPIYSLSNLDEILGDIAANFYESNQKDVFVVGITGTNGKTSVSHFLAQALETLGHKAAVLGTVGNGFVDDLQQSDLTTMDVFRAHGKIRELADMGAQYICMEVSSHSIDQKRIAGIDFGCAAFTNLSQDHLDYHGDIESYARCKASFFHQKGLKRAVINLDQTGVQIAESIDQSVKLLTLSHDQESPYYEAADLKLLNAEVGDGLKISFSLSSDNYEIKNKQLSGFFNVENLLISFLVLKQLGFAENLVCHALSKVYPVVGRLQEVKVSSFEQNQATQKKEMASVYVDYAHTPDGLYKVLQVLHKAKSANANLFVVFGCGGDRDRAKRKLMAQAVEQFANFVFVTSDNPRTEPQSQITADILAGFSKDYSEKVFVEDDRELAIERAVIASEPGDVVLIAGKGHEQVQIFSDHVIEFDDYQVATEVLRRAGNSEVLQ